jgi:biopolymer transport protein ExbD
VGFGRLHKRTPVYARFCTSGKELTVALKCSFHLHIAIIGLVSIIALGGCGAITQGANISAQMPSIPVESVPQNGYRIHVGQDGSVSVNGRLCPLAQLASKLTSAGAGSDDRIVLSAPAKVSHAAVMEVITALQASGYRSVAFSVKD